MELGSGGTQLGGLKKKSPIWKYGVGILKETSCWVERIECRRTETQRKHEEKRKVARFEEFEALLYCNNSYHGGAIELPQAGVGAT